MEITKKNWTPELVSEWIHIAVQVERVLPRVGPQMARPKLTIVRDYISMLWDELSEDKPEPRFQPTNEQVSMWEEVALRWFPLVDSGKDKKILWWRSGGMGWKRIGKQIGLERHTVANRYEKALKELAKALNRQ